MVCRRIHGRMSLAGDLARKFGSEEGDGNEAEKTNLQA